MTIHPLFIGTLGLPELLIILFIVFLIFGANKLRSSAPVSAKVSRISKSRSRARTTSSPRTSRSRRTKNRKPSPRVLHRATSVATSVMMSVLVRSSKTTEPRGDKNFSKSGASSCALA